jgi:hypothetical protein
MELLVVTIVSQIKRDYKKNINPLVCRDGF